MKVICERWRHFPCGWFKLRKNVEKLAVWTRMENSGLFWTIFKRWRMDRGDIERNFLNYLEFLEILWIFQKIPEKLELWNYSRNGIYDRVKNSKFSHQPKIHSLPKLKISNKNERWRNNLFLKTIFLPPKKIRYYSHKAISIFLKFILSKLVENLVDDDDLMSFRNFRFPNGFSK